MRDFYTQDGGGGGGGDGGTHGVHMGYTMSKQSDVVVVSER